MDSKRDHDTDLALVQKARDNTVVAALMLVGLATFVSAAEAYGFSLGIIPGRWAQLYLLPLTTPPLMIALWFYNSRLERRTGINVVQGQLALLIALSFIAALPSISGGPSFSLFHGVLLLLLATKIADQRLIVAGVIATVAWIAVFYRIVYTGESLFLGITAGLILGCIFAPKHPRNSPLARAEKERQAEH